MTNLNLSQCRQKKYIIQEHTLNTWNRFAPTVYNRLRLLDIYKKNSDSPS